jgi:hypothetical protein
MVRFLHAFFSFLSFIDYSFFFFFFFLDLSAGSSEYSRCQPSTQGHDFASRSSIGSGDAAARERRVLGESSGVAGTHGCVYGRARG